VWLCQQHGLNAVSMSIAEQYIAAFSNLAKETNTVLLPSNSGDISGMVSQVQPLFLKLIMPKLIMLPKNTNAEFWGFVIRIVCVVVQ